MTSTVLQSGTSTMFATYGYEAGAAITQIGQATAAAAAGFASGGIMGGNLQSAVAGALTAAVTAGVTMGVSESNLGVQVGAKMGTSAALAYVQGGDWRRAAYFAGFAELGRAGWELARGDTDRLYSASCGAHSNCSSDSFGYQTDGGRNILPGFEQSEQDRVPRFIKSYLDGGMSMEGGDHMYSPGNAICRAIGSSLCAAVRGFVRQVSKPHDWGNSWSYDQNSMSANFGDRIEGGGFSSLTARVAYEVGVQSWSLATMPVMAAYTAISLYGNNFNPNLYGIRRTR